MTHTKALLRENRQWQNPEHERPLALVRVSTDKNGMFRAADVLHLLLVSAAKAGRSGWGLWRLMTSHSRLVVRIGPNGETREFFEEFPVLQKIEHCAPVVRR
ncbi:MAG TPA: hypothetical protein PL182_06870 [Pseudobdellovibrionaceae bacterium]|nr:hypothetical protein [Pseudobdellovibrionaceae bacterium]